MQNLASHPELLEDVAELLAKQWPEQGFSTRAHGLRAYCRNHSSVSLPCHLVLVDENETNRVAAHCRLQRACETADGFSAAITSVIVKPHLRGRGLGRQLLSCVELEAAERGFGYLYLWTHDQCGFYAACGYHECERVTLFSPALALVGGEAVKKLEQVIAAKAQAALVLSQAGPSEAVAREDSVWMRKRLLEQGAAVSRTMQELENACSEALPGLFHVQLAVSQIAWERQIGPCCGLAALRMARSAERRDSLDGLLGIQETLQQWLVSADVSKVVEFQLTGNPTVTSDASVLQEAVSRGFSSDGEVFDIHHLAELAADVCGFQAIVLAGTDDVWCRGLPQWLASGGIAIVAYDRNDASHLPASCGGTRAHYALIIGLAHSTDSNCLKGSSEKDLEGGSSGSVSNPILVCMHGLSPQPLLVSLAEMRASCEQLLAMRPSGKNTGWIEGPAGIRLSNRLLLLA